MKVLVACEYSGKVRDAFTRKGHEAMSCDLLPTDEPGNHFMGDIREILNNGWDLMIAHPPCTRLCVSGNRWRKDLVEETAEAIDRPSLRTREDRVNPPSLFIVARIFGSAV